MTWNSRRLVSCLALAVAASCSTTEPERSTRALEFGESLGFEQTEGDPSPPWGGGGGGYERSIACGTAPEGQCVVTITSGSAPLAPNAFASMTQCVADASPLAGKRVRLSGRLRTERVEGFAGVWLRVDPQDREGRPLAFDNMAAQHLDGTTDWRRHGVTVAVPKEETGGACFGVLLSGTGRVEADDLEFETIG